MIIDEAGLRRLYDENTAARAILDHFASRERNRTVTTVDRLQSILASQGTVISRKQVIEVFRGLEAARCGDFVVGRHSWPSRFKWKVGMVAVGQSAAGEPVEMEPAPPDEQAEEAALEMLEHKFQLRADIGVSLSLPTNLTATEASRLSDFIRTLPFAP